MHIFGHLSCLALKKEGKLGTRVVCAQASARTITRGFNIFVQMNKKGYLSFPLQSSYATKSNVSR